MVFFIIIFNMLYLIQTGENTDRKEFCPAFRSRWNYKSAQFKSIETKKVLYGLCAWLS